LLISFPVVGSNAPAKCQQGLVRASRSCYNGTMVLRDALLKRKAQIVEQQAALAAELEKLEALLAFYIPAKSNSKDGAVESVPGVVHLSGSFRMGTPPLPDRAAEAVRDILLTGPEPMLRVSALLDKLPPDLRAEYQQEPRVAVETLRSQILSRKAKYSLAYENGLVFIDKTPLKPLADFPKIDFFRKGGDGSEAAPET
jgi:hypothetical protein